MKQGIFGYQRYPKELFPEKFTKILYLGYPKRKVLVNKYLKEIFKCFQTENEKSSSPNFWEGYISI